MIIKIDEYSDVPIYMQIRNQIQANSKAANSCRL